MLNNSAILNIELHCSKYCKKIIIFYLTLSPLSLISHPCLSSLSLHRRTQHPQPSTISCHPQQPLASQHHRADPTQHHITLISHLCLSSLSLHRQTQHHITPSATATRNPAPQSTTHEFAIYDPRSNTAKPTRQSTTHDPQPEQCEYELVMERMKFWVSLKPSCEI